MELINLEKLDKRIRKVLESYLDRMIRVNGGNIRSIFIYGSGACREFVPKRSNINIAVIMEKITVSDLKKNTGLVSSGRRKGIVAPLFLTMEHVLSSTDVFPVEFLEMKENYLLLFGEDILKELGIKPDNIRLQCEQQVKGGLIRLYEACMETGIGSKKVKELMSASITSLMPVFRNLLRLKGKTPPVKKEEIIEGMSGEFSLDGELFHKILKIKRGEKFTDNSELLIGRYMEELDKLAGAVDRMKV